jgi:hypothetical protein
MANEITSYDTPEADDGFHGSINNGGRLRRGISLNWTDAEHWTDRDKLSQPSPLLAIGCKEALERWKGRRAESIDTLPLPDPDQLNAAIPIEEWEVGVDNKPRKPWAHVVAVYFVNAATGELYSYVAATVGAHIAFEALREAVIMMRMLRGAKCMPLVSLAEKPWRTSFGLRRRPDFRIVGWKTPGDDNKAIAARPLPQLTGGAAEAVPTSVTPATSPPPQRQTKPSVNFTDETLALIEDVVPPTSSEILDDELPF